MTGPATPSTEQRRAVGLAAAGTTTAMIAFTLPLIGLTDTATDLRAGPAGQAWILSSMSIGLAVALLVAGALADRIGRVQVMLVGAVVLAATSVAAAVATGVVWFVAARIGQGIGGAAVMAAGLGLITERIPAGPGRIRATGLWGASLGGGIAIGPLLTAASTSLVSWRLTHLLVTVGAVAVTVAGRRGVPSRRAAEQTRRADLLGAVLFAVAIVAVMVPLVEVRLTGPSPLVLGSVVVAVLFGVGFLVWERRQTDPMIDLALFRRPAFLGATVAALGTGLSVIAVMSFLATFLRRGYGVGVVGAALIFVAWSGVSAVVPVLFRSRLARWPGSPQLSGGLLGLAVSLMMMLGLGPGSSPLRLLPALLVAGVATGVLNGALGREAVGSVPPHRAAMGSGANNTARYLGSALGVTVVAVLAAAPKPEQGGLFVGFQHAVWVCAAAALVAAIVVGWCGRVGRGEHD